MEYLVNKKKVKSVDNVTNRKIISVFMKYPRKIMVSLNRANVKIAVIKMEPRYEVNIFLNFKGYCIRS